MEQNTISSETPQQPATPDDDQAATTASVAEQADTVQEDIGELKQQLETQNDKYLRLMAEFDNFKRRTAREYEQKVEAANERLIGELIDVREDFSRALCAGGCGESSSGYVKGIELVFQRFDAVLSRNGLEAYGEAGEEFNAELHDAMMKHPHSEIPADHISEVFSRGYRLKGRIIRHAKVVVSAGPEQTVQEGE